LKDDPKNRVDDENADVTHSMTIQKVFRGFLSRIYIDQEREKELIFLGMAAGKKPEDDPIAEYEKNQKSRKMKKDEHLNEYLNALEELQGVVQKNEGADIEETMKEERRKWMIDHINNHEFKEVPKIEEFYKREAEGRVLTSEEEAKKKVEEEEKKKKEKEEKKKAKGKGKDKDKKGKKGKKKGKKKDKEPKSDGTKWIGTTEAI